ncbi:hypothetical protein CLOSCI_01128 [[Clostridium] scindens ATCC 35704]|nr:hypothetical protein CLOSCI_01128 [[Clostridium] scindens ATCC 35704]
MLIFIPPNIILLIIIQNCALNIQPKVGYINDIYFGRRYKKLDFTKTTTIQENG